MNKVDALHAALLLRRVLVVLLERQEKDETLIKDQTLIKEIMIIEVMIKGILIKVDALYAALLCVLLERKTRERYNFKD